MSVYKITFSTISIPRYVNIVMIYREILDFKLKSHLTYVINLFRR